MTLVCRLIGESCGQLILTCLKNANTFFGLSTMKPSWLQRRGKDGANKSYNYDSESIEHCLWSYMYTNMIWGKNYTHSSGMWHGRLDFIWLCYMVVS